MRPKLSKEEKAIIDAHNARLRAQHLEQDFKMNETRGRGITVGTAFGGTTEISMRRSDGTNTWIIMQPVEVVELINQLAANVGCHIHLQPRQDFASWRSWNYSTEELTHFRGPMSSLGGGGHPPHVKAIAPGSYTSPLPAPEEQPGMPTPILKEEHEPVAVETPKRRRAAKRASASS